MSPNNKSISRFGFSLREHKRELGVKQYASSKSQDNLEIKNKKRPPVENNTNRPIVESVV